MAGRVGATASLIVLVLVCQQLGSSGVQFRVRSGTNEGLHNYTAGGGRPTAHTQSFQTGSTCLATRQGTPTRGGRKGADGAWTADWLSSLGHGARSGPTTRQHRPLVWRVLRGRSLQQKRALSPSGKLKKPKPPAPQYKYERGVRKKCSDNCYQLGTCNEELGRWVAVVQPVCSAERAGSLGPEPRRCRSLLSLGAGQVMAIAVAVPVEGAVRHPIREASSSLCRKDRGACLPRGWSTLGRRQGL